MADLNAPNVFIQVKISEETEKGTYNDALYYSVADYEKMKDDEVTLAIQTRVDNWLKSITEPVAVEPTLDELVKWKTSLEDQLVDVNAQIASK